MPALVNDELESIAQAHRRDNPKGADADKIVGWLGAFLSRVMFPGSLAAAARRASAEPLWTGRARVYAESTIREAAHRLDAEGAWIRVADAVWSQVTRAAAKVDEQVLAYTDMFDQPYYTKKRAHAAPIGRLGNRILACAYFGLTTIQVPGGPTLFAHLSWHKPAAPLRDALEDLFSDDARMDWWHRNVRLHIVDRGANGDPVLQWMWAWEVPYLTIGRESARLAQLHTPTLTNELGLPIVVRPDLRLDGDADDGPWEVIVPADAANPNETRGICFRSAVMFTETELLGLNSLYKSRWPSMENELKSAQALGFGRNRTRRLQLCVSRGTEGALARLRVREETQVEKAVELGKLPPTPSNLGRLIAASRKVFTLREQQASLATSATLKHARVEGGAERLGKWLHLLAQNALALALASSPDEEVRAMTTPMVFELLLGCSALTVIEAGRLTIWIDAIDAPDQRRRQAALVDVFNQLALRCRGSVVTIHLRERADRKVA